VFGEDVAAKGGLYGVTRGLRAAVGGGRVSVAALRDIPGLITACSARPDDAPALLR